MFEAQAQTSAAPTDPAAVDTLAASAPQSVDEAVRVDPAFILSKIETWIVGFQRLLPNILVALALFAIVFGIAWAVERSFRTWAAKRDRSNLGAVRTPRSATARLHPMPCCGRLRQPNLLRRPPQTWPPSQRCISFEPGHLLGAGQGALHQPPATL